MDVLGEDGDLLGMDRAQVGVVKQAHKVGVGCLLKRQDRLALEPQVALEVNRDLPDAGRAPCGAGAPSTSGSA